MMKKLLITVGLMVYVFTAIGQEPIDEAHIALKLPNNKWELKNKIDQNGMQVYFYKR